VRFLSLPSLNSQLFGESFFKMSIFSPFYKLLNQAPKRKIKSRNRKRVFSTIFPVATQFTLQRQFLIHMLYYYKKMLLSTHFKGFFSIFHFILRLL